MQALQRTRLGAVRPVLAHAVAHMPGNMVAKMVAFLAAVAVAVLPLPILVGCAGSDQEFREIAPSARFALLRETAAWSPGFDPRWWSRIDAAYAEYDAAAERVVRMRWEPHAMRATLAMQREMKSGDREARALRAAQVGLDAELGALDRALADDLRTSLPREAEPFVELLVARLAFARAAAHWQPGASVLPTPFAMLDRTGEPIADATLAAEVAASTARLALDAAAASRRRIDAHVKRLDDYAAATAALAERAAAIPDEAARAKDADLQRLSADRNAISEAWKRERAEADESLRRALVRESLRVAELIADPERRERFEARSFEALHEGVFATRSFDAAVAMARRVVEREKPGDAERLAEFDAIATASRTRQLDGVVRLRAAEAAGDTAGIKRGVETLRISILGIAGFVRNLVGEQRFNRLTGEFNRVRLGVVDTAEAVRKAYDDAEPAEEASPPEPIATELAGVDESIGESRDPGMRALLGSALSPRTAAELSRALRLDEGEQAQLEAFRKDEARRLVEQTTPFLDAMKAVGDGLRANRGEGAALDPKSQARAAMREVRGFVSRLSAADSAANARFLAEAERLAGARAADADGQLALAAARLELDLEGTSSLSDRRRDSEILFGVQSESAVSPFEIARRIRPLAARDAIDIDAIRQAAVAAIVRRADEWRVSAAELREGQMRNLEEFLVVLIAQDDAERLGIPVFRPDSAGPRATELRFLVADDLRAMLGAEAADAYLDAFRRSVQESLEPRRTPAFAALERLTSAATAEREDRAATASIRARLASVVETADAERRLALLATHRWRSAWVLTGRDLDDDEDWREIAWISPTGALLRARIEDCDERALAIADEMLASDDTAPRAWIESARTALRDAGGAERRRGDDGLRKLAPRLE